MRYFLLLLALSLTAFAQTAPTLARLFSYRPAPGAASEFNDIQRDTAAIYRANKAPFARLVWTTLAGPPTMYMFVPLASLADLNEPTWISKQGTEIERAGRQMRLARASDPPEIQVVMTVPELTWDDTPNGEPDAFAEVSIIQVKPSRVQAFIAAAKDINEATKQMDKAKSIHVNRTRYGGNAYRFHMVRGYASLADISIDPGAFRKALGEAKYAVYLKSNAENIESVERTLVRYRPEFSYIPQK